METIRSLLFIYYFTMKSIDAIPYDFCHKAALKGNFNCENIYIWKSDQKDFISLLNVTLKKPEGNDLKALEGKTVRVIADNMRPYVISNNKSSVLSGFLGNVWSIVQDALKFESKIVSVDYDTGLAIISRGNADVMLAAGIVKRDLLGVEYSHPYLHNWYHLYVREPERRASPGSYLKTLSQNLWIVSVLFFLFLTFCLWFTLKFLNSKFKLERNTSFSKCFLCVCSGFLNQGIDLGLITCTGRMLVFFSLIPGYILLSSINAVLISRLATSNSNLPIRSLDDVLTLRLPICLRTNSFVYNHFTSLRGEKKIVNGEWRGLLNGPGCKDINKQTNLAAILCNERIVILESRIVAASVVNDFHINCDIARVNRRYFVNGNAYLLRRGFNGKEAIETVIHLMRSTGVLRRLEDKWMKFDSRKNEKNPLSYVTIDHIRGLLYFYVIMIFNSLVVLWFEILYIKHDFLKKRSR